MDNKNLRDNPNKRDVSPHTKEKSNPKKTRYDFSNNPKLYSDDGGLTTASSRHNTETSSNPSNQATQKSEHTIEQKISNAIEKKEKGESLTKDDKKYLLWQKKANGETLNYNEKVSLSLFKNKNGIELSEGEEETVKRINKNNKKRNKEVQLALAIECNIKGKKLTSNQQDLLQEIPEDDRKTLTDKRKSLIEQYRNNSEKQYNKLKYLTNIIKENKYNEVIEAYDNRITQAKEDGNTEEAGKQQRERESFQKTWNAFLQTKRGKEIKELLQRQQILNNKLSDTQHDQSTLENIQQHIDNNKSQIEEQITAYFEESRETNDLNDLLNHVFSLYDSSDTNLGLLYSTQTKGD